MSSILVAGVAVLDFIFQMQDFPQAAEKYRADGAIISGGGNGANAAVAISRLGGEAHLAARLGDDEIADLILAGLKQETVQTELVRRFEDRRSSFSSIYIDKAGERQIVNYRDTALPLDAEWLASAIPSNMKAALADPRWPEGARVAMEAAKTKGVPGVLDVERAVPEAEAAMRMASHIAFSAHGLRDYTNEDDLAAAALRANKDLPGIVIVTDGAQGVLVVEDKELQWHSAFDIEAVDTLGAGDIWHGAFTLALVEGKLQNEAIRFASAAAALKCTRPGGRDGAPDRAELEQFLKLN